MPGSRTMTVGPLDPLPTETGPTPEQMALIVRMARLVLDARVNGNEINRRQLIGVVDVAALRAALDAAEVRRG